jgi:very-short-patch-repair endonuclease
MVGSVGVVTPFRAQRKLIEGFLEARRVGGVKVDTADGFQGGERDAMVFSPVMARGMEPGPVAFASDERRVNVAVTRARDVLVVVADRDFCRGHEGVIRWLVDYCDEIEELRRTSPAEVALFNRLMLEGIDRRTHEVILDMEEDFVIPGRVKDLVVRVQGGQHAEHKREDDARKAALAARGFLVLDVSGREVLETPDYVIGRIRDLLDQG